MVPKNRVSLLVGRCLRRHLRASPWNGDLLNASLRHPLKRLPAEVNATSFDASETVGTCPPNLFSKAGGRRQGF